MKEPTTWEQYLFSLEFSYISSKYTLTRYRAFMLMYSFQPWAPIDVNCHSNELGSIPDLFIDIYAMFQIT